MSQVRHLSRRSRVSCRQYPRPAARVCPVSSSFCGPHCFLRPTLEVLPRSPQISGSPQGSWGTGKPHVLRPSPFPRAPRCWMWTVRDSVCGRWVWGASGYVLGWGVCGVAEWGLSGSGLHMHAHMYTHEPMYTHTHMHTHIHIYPLIHAHTHTHTYIH